MFFHKKEPNQIRLSEAENYLHKRFETEINNEKSKIESMVSSIILKFNEIKTIVEELHKKSAKKSISNTIKNKYCDRILGSIDGLKTPDANYSHISSFIQMANIVQKTISGLNYKEFKHLQEFKQDMSKVSQISKSINKELKDLETFSEKSTIKKIEEIGRLVSDISRSRKAFDDMESMLRDTGTTLTRIRDETETQRKKLGAAQSTATSEDECELRRIESRISNIKQKITNDFSGLDKILKRMKHEGEKGLDRYIKNVFEGFVEEGVDIRDVIEKSLNFVSSGKMYVDAKQRDRLHKLSLDVDMLLEMREEYIDLAEKKKSIEEDLNKRKQTEQSHIKSIEDALKEKEKELDTLTKKRDARMSERKKLEEYIQKTADDVQKKLSEMLQRDIKVEL